MELLPTRAGPRPRTLPRPPHSQLDQNPSAEWYAAVAEFMFSLPGVQDCPSGISVPGARAMCIDAERCTGPKGAFMIGHEFAHLHPPYDGSLHVCLPPELALHAIERGWAEPHPIAAQMGMDTLVMLYGPRDDAELSVVTSLIQASLDFATSARD